MIPVTKSRGKKRVGNQQQEPLKSKSTNVRTRTGFDKSLRFLGDTNSVGGKVDKFMKTGPDDKQELVFTNDHVSIRLGDLNNAPESGKSQGRLSESPNTSLQLDEFNEPPDSTSTPIPSPSKYLDKWEVNVRQAPDSPIYYSSNNDWNQNFLDHNGNNYRIFSTPLANRGGKETKHANQSSDDTTGNSTFISSGGDATYNGSSSNCNDLARYGS